MSKIKRLLTIFLMFFLVSFLFSCEIVFNNTNQPSGNTPSGDDTEDYENLRPSGGSTNLYIYAVNDFHGIVYKEGESVGLSRLFGYLRTQKEKNPNNTVILSSGDMFQGSGLSSMSRGKIVLDAMNYVGFDAMAIGNHEFDWGLEEVTKYVDGSLENGEATFPILGANVLKVSDGKIADLLQPYVVIKRAGLNIGVIGLIGKGEESDILTSYVKDYVFTDELTAIKKYAKILREDEKCDIVIVSAHVDTSDINRSIANLTGSEKVDAVLNGHTHQSYYSEESRNDKSTPMPVVQSGCYGRFVGLIVLTYDFDKNEVTKSSVINQRAESVCTKEDPNINKLFDDYRDLVEITSEELGVSGVTLYQNVGGYFCSDSLVEKFDVDLGVCNRGGIRGSGFPIYRDDVITYGDVFEIMPFENMVVIVELKGEVIISRIFSGASNFYFISTNVDVSNRTINGVKIDLNKTYRIATIDYLYEKTNQPFMYSTYLEKTNILFRDVIAEGIKNNVKANGTFKYNHYE